MPHQLGVLSDLSKKNPLVPRVINMSLHGYFSPPASSGRCHGNHHQLSLRLYQNKKAVKNVSLNYLA